MTDAEDSSQRWDLAPCGLLELRPDATVVAANATFLTWVDRTADELVGHVRLPDLLSVGGRIFWETHLAPLLLVDGHVDEVALVLRTAAGDRPVVLSASVDAAAGVVRVAVTPADVRSRYERELLAARASAELSESRLRALQDTTAALSRALGVTAVADALVEAALGPLRAATATVWLGREDGALVLHRAPGAGTSPTVRPSRVLAQSRTAAQDAGRVVVPLHGSSRLQGVLVVTARAEAGADPLDLEVLTAVGQQAGLALDRAQRYEHSASVARDLQHSLLAGEPPSDPRFAVATAYRPGVEMLEVGGDWHDVFRDEDGRLCFLVGDVVGRGLGAASAMGQLRSAVRAVAGAGTEPAALLMRLDHFVDQVETARMATLVYAELDLDDGTVRYACAGHPPPLLLPADGPARLLWGGRSTPLGTFTRHSPREQAEVRLAPGDRLLLYTDGLFERRDRGLDEGLDLLVSTGASVAHLPMGEAVSELTGSLLRDEVVRDDVCVLLLSWTGAGVLVGAAD